MSAPTPIGKLLSDSTSVGMPPATIATTGAPDCQEYDKVLIVVNGSAVGLAGAETIKIYAKNSGTFGVGGVGPSGTTPVYDQTGAVAQLTASLQSVMLEGGFWYVFVKGVTANAVGLDFHPKRLSGD